MAITEYIRNVERAILNTVFENTVLRVNKCLETGEGHFEHYFNHQVHRDFLITLYNLQAGSVMICLHVSDFRHSRQYRV